MHKARSVVNIMKVFLPVLLSLINHRRQPAAGLPVIDHRVAPPRRGGTVEGSTSPVRWTCSI